MKPFQFPAESALSVAPALEYTRLSDIDSSLRDAASLEMSDAPVDPAWSAIIQGLAKQYPGAMRRDLALAVFAAYAARVSEDAAAVFPLGLYARDDGAYRYGPASLALGPKTRFEDALAVARQAASRAIGDLRRDPGALPAQSLSCVVTAGDVAAAPLATHLRLHCHDDGAISLWRAAGLDPDAAARVVDRMIALAQGVIDDPSTPLLQQPIMSAQERKMVVQDWNATAKPYDFDGGLVAMMARAADTAPDHPALIFKDAQLSYSEFHSRVDRLARRLRAMGVGKDQLVALCMDRSLEMVIGLWATLKAGGAYVPLNVEDPDSRIAEILADCRPKALLTQESIRDRFASLETEIVVLPEGGDIGPTGEEGAPDVEIGAHDLAYMIYTSGSTGKPKGVVVEHAAIHNRILWMHDEYGLRPEDRVLQKTPYTFDVSVWEFLWPLAVGATLVIAEPGGHTAISYLHGLIRRSRVTHLHFVPSVLRLFLMAPGLDTLPIKNLFCSGEALGADLVEAFYAKASETAAIHNLYGPTEAAVDVSYFACKRGATDPSIPIGRPVANTGLYVLDPYDQPVPVGVPGELHIGGVQLARGYWAREELTAERFIACPIADAPHDRLYRTGDLAYFRPDGQIIYLGRNDFQVKVNGVRIELGEVEAAIREQSGVKDVVVVPEEQGAGKRLVAYVVAEAPSMAEAQRLQDGVAATRPTSYTPQEVRFIAKMPLSTAGKINRKALADQARLGEG